MLSRLWQSSRYPIQVFLILVVVLIAFACAGKTLSRVGGEVTLPKELPTDFKEKFEVKEVAAVQSGNKTISIPSPSPAPNVPKTRDDKNTKKVKGKVPQNSKESKAVVAQPFVYPNRRPTKDPIWVGEKMVFDITYFGMSAGEFGLEALPHKVINHRKVYHIKGTAISSRVFSLFYRLNDTVESFFDYEGLFSHRFRLILDESKQTRDALELNDSEKKESFYWNRWHPSDRGFQESKGFFPMESFSQDSVSALYYLRTRPLDLGTVVTFPVINEGKNWEAVLTVVRREKIETPIGRVPTLVVKLDTKYQGILQKKGDSFIWLTDDERHFVVRLEAQVKIGTVIARSKEIVRGTPSE